MPFAKSYFWEYYLRAFFATSPSLRDASLNQITIKIFKQIRKFRINRSGLTLTHKSEACQDQHKHQAFPVPCMIKRGKESQVFFKSLFLKETHYLRPTNSTQTITISGYKPR